MAKYAVTYKCGHAGAVDIVGTNVNGERERKAAWYAQQLCPECYKAAKAAEAEKANEGYPELRGSDKQVAWANQIRANMIKTYAREIEATRANLDKAKAMLTAGGVPAHIKDKAQLIINIIECNEAKWFIDNRNR